LDNNFFIQLIAGLSKTKSKKQIKSDARSLGNMYVKLIGNLDMSKTRKAIKAQLKGLNNLAFNITPKVNTKGVQSATRQAVNNAQKVANNNKVHLNFDTSKQQLVNQIKILGRNNNKLFNDREMTVKYNQLLNSANVAKSTGELKTLRGELSAFKTELVATNNAGMTWGSKFKESVKSYTKFFSGASLVYAISNQVRNAATEAKTLDDSLVDLQKVTDEIADRDALYKYFDKSLSKAQELNVKVGSLINAVTEFKKLGWDLDDAELGAKWANILSNVGDVDIDTAIGSIKTSIASFDEIGGYTDEQMDKKLEAYTDLINNMSNKYSIDAEGLAESIRLSAGTLTEAHMSIEQAATLFATANKYYNDPSYLGNTAKIGSLRIRASSGDTDAIEELREMGEEVDDLATATSNLREKLMALTGVDIMEDEHTFKSYYDQLYEIAQVMDKLDDTSRANVLETMFGKSRSAAGAAILSGMKESASAYEDAINSAGSATEEYQTWMTSADAACQRFSNTLTETYQSIINGNTVRDLANLGSAVLEFANNWGIVEGTLKGVIAINIGKFITTGGMALITATKQVEQYGKALQMASNVPNGNLSNRFQALKSIAQATSTLTTEQLRNVLSTNTLTQADRVRILQMQGMTKEMALQKFAEMNLTQATNAQNAANTASTASTFSLKAAMAGLGATLKSVFLSNPVGIVLMGISLGVSAVTSAVSKHNQAVEEARQKAKEAADNANTLGDEIAELANKYIQLSDAVKTDASAKEDLMTTQTELLKKLELEGESIDDLIAKYGSLSNAIKQASIDSLKDQQIDLIAGVDAAREELIKAGKDAFGSDSWKKSIVAMGEEAGKAWQVLEDAGIISSGTHTDVGGEWFLSGDASEQGVLENYKTIEKALEALRDSNKFTQEELSQNDLFKELYDRYNTVKEAAESYDSEIDNLNENLAQQTMLTALQGNELPKTEEDFDKFKQELIDTAVASKQFIGNEKEITDAINNYLSTVPEFEGYYSIPLENELDKVDELLHQEDFSKTLLSISETVDAVNTKLKPALDSLKTVYQSVFPSDGFTLDDVDVSMLESLKKSFEDLKENGIDIATEDFENFTRVITDSSTTSDEAQRAFNKLATTLVNNSKVTLVSDDAFNTLVQTLEQLGITNAEEALQGLRDIQSEIASKGYDLANITNEQAAAFINEGNASAEAVTYLQYYMIQKQLAEQPLSTVGDVESLENLCNTLGVTGEMLQEVINLKNMMNAVNAGAPTAEFMPRIEESKKKIAELAKGEFEYKFDFKPELDSSKASGSAKDIAEEFKNLLDAELKVLDTKMDAGLINFNDYIAQRLALIQKYYDEGKIKASDYYDYLSKHYETQLSYMDKVTSYVTTRIDKEIDSYNKQIDQIKEKYQTEIDYLDTVIDYYEKQKEVLQDANTQRELQLALQKALYDLEKAQTQRSRKIYADNHGYIYRADGDAIRDAQDNLNKAKLDIQINEIDKAIKKVQEQQDALKKAMDKEVEAINKIIENLEAYKEKWSSIAKEYEEKQNEMIAQQMLGADIEKEILAGRLDVLEDFKNKYLAIQQAIKDANANAAQAALNEANKPSTGGGSDSGSGNGTKVTTTPKSPLVSDAEKKRIQEKNKKKKQRLTGGGTKKLVARYANGTKDAEPGYHEIAENGDELIRDNYGNAYIAKGHQLHNFEGGETVYDAGDTKELLGGRLVPIESMPGISESLKNLMAYANTPDASQLRIQPNIPDYNMLKSVDSKSSTNSQVYVTQNVNVTLPNVTNEAGFNNFKKELDRLKLDAYQFANKRNK